MIQVRTPHKARAERVVGQAEAELLGRLQSLHGHSQAHAGRMDGGGILILLFI